MDALLSRFTNYNDYNPYTYAFPEKYFTSATGSRFRAAHSQEMRRAESARLAKHYPERIAVIAEPIAGSNLELDKHKYLVPGSLTAGQLMYVFRKRMQLEPAQALFMFVGPKHVMSISSDTVRHMSESIVSDDGFLYVELARENTFG